MSVLFHASHAHGASFTVLGVCGRAFTGLCLSSAIDVGRPSCLAWFASLDVPPLVWTLGAWFGAFLLAFWVSGIRYIRHDRVGVVEKLWSSRGSLAHGALLAREGEAGYQTDLLRGGLHFGLWRWQYRVHHLPLVTVPQGRLGYVYARDGEPLAPEQTLARVVPSNHFQDAGAFLAGDLAGVVRGQRGRQRALLREGMYAINLALFVVITEEVVYRLDLGDRDEARSVERWQRELASISAFAPVVIGAREGGSTADDIGIVTVHDGPSLAPGQIIAPAAGTDGTRSAHGSSQDAEACLAAGGRRGRQLVPLIDGTYYLNRWFATVERIGKTVVPIGFVGVVVSYHGNEDGRDLSGTGFRHGELVAEGDRGVLERTLGPGKYPFNTYAGQVHLVPTTNFVLHWITGRTEAHRYDESLMSIDLVTADAYEPVLPLSIVVHIDYERAPSVVQRFGDVQRLITQTLDPLLSAYFRDIVQKKTMLELLHDRDTIQREAVEALRRRFAEFDIQLVDVLIGKPESLEDDDKIETLLEQLRLRQLSREQLETYDRQRLAAEKLTTLRQAEAIAQKQTELTHSKVEIEIAQNRGSADLERARLLASQTVVTAEAESRRKVLLAEADGRERAIVGEGEARRITVRGEAEAAVLRSKIASYGDARLFATALLARFLSTSRQPLVPARMMVSAAAGASRPGAVAAGPLSALLDLLVADKSGVMDAGPVADPAAGPASDRGAAA